MTKLGRDRTIALALTLLLAGRGMTIAFIGRAGDGGAGDPPAAWLMPLIGDAVIGISALAVVYLIVSGRGLGAWVAIVTWNVLGIWDAASAFLVQQSVPWNEFFMIEAFGSSMFLAASTMHAVNIGLMSRRQTRNRYLPHGTSAVLNTQEA